MLVNPEGQRLEKTTDRLGQAKGIAKLPIGEQSSISRDLGTCRPPSCAEGFSSALEKIYSVAKHVDANPLKLP